MRKPALSAALHAVSAAAALAGVTLAPRSAVAQAPTGPAAPSTAPPAPVAAPPAPMVCLVGDHPGVDDGPARVAASLVCDELRRLGRPVTAPTDNVAGAPGAYRIDLQRLDRTVILRVAEEAPVGIVRDSRRLTVAGLDEVAVAAPRIASALVWRRPLESTEQVDNLVEQEARENRKKSGESLWGLGLAGWGAPGVAGGVRPMFDLAFTYEARAFAVVADARFTISGERESSGASVGSLSVGGRYFFSPADLTPFVGAGLAYDWGSYRTDDATVAWKYENNGLAPYAEAGVEVLRTHRARLLLAARVDVPTFTFRRTTANEYTYGSMSVSVSQQQGPAVADTKYVLPIQAGLTVMF